MKQKEFKIGTRVDIKKLFPINSMCDLDDLDETYEEFLIKNDIGTIETFQLDLLNGEGIFDWDIILFENKVYLVMHHNHGDMLALPEIIIEEISHITDDYFSNKYFKMNSNHELGAGLHLEMTEKEYTTRINQWVKVNEHLRKYIKK